MTAVPWANWGFALFASHANGSVYTAAGDPQRGLPAPWVPISDGLVVAPGTPVTALPWENGLFALFGSHVDGSVCTAAGDPERGLPAPWVPISDGIVVAPGTPVTAVPWANFGFALFATHVNGSVYTAAGDPQRGLSAPWVPVSDGLVIPPGSLVAAVPWECDFALFVTNRNGGVYTTTGDPQKGFGPWVNVSGITAAPGSPVTAAPFREGLTLFATNYQGQICTVQGDKTFERLQTRFRAIQHGWHFDNLFVNEIVGKLIETNGLCGGMAYSALDYYFSSLSIPTHRSGDFGKDDSGQESPVPLRGLLHDMIFNRLMDSFRDNFGKWSCVYRELDAAVGLAIGLVVGSAGGEGIIWGLAGAVAGEIVSEVNEVLDCPRGGPSGMTRQELPKLTGNFLDKGIPVPIGLIFDDNFNNIGLSHQVVAYGYSMCGTVMTIYIYDNRHHDEECTLTVDTGNPGPIKEVGQLGDDLGVWEGLLVEDGYRPQFPSYGYDIGPESVQSLQLIGPVVMVTTVPRVPSTNSLVASLPSYGSPDRRRVPIVMVPQQQQFQGELLVDIYAVQNYGEFTAHYASLGIEIDGPDGSQSFAIAPPAASDNTLAPGQGWEVTIGVPSFGSAPGVYTLLAGFNSTEGVWSPLPFPPASVTVNTQPSLNRNVHGPRRTTQK